MKGPASQRLAVRAIAVAALLALAGTVSDCAPTSPTPAVSPWMDPAWLASEAARKKKVMNYWKLGHSATLMRFVLLLTRIFLR
jgi:hypothetical protein